MRVNGVRSPKTTWGHANGTTCCYFSKACLRLTLMSKKDGRKQRIIKGETDHGSGRLRSDHLGKFPLGAAVATLILGGEKATRGWLHCGKGESTSLSVIASLMEDSTHVFR
jgi:hypothetical protein